MIWERELPQKARRIILTIFVADAVVADHIMSDGSGVLPAVMVYRVGYASTVGHTRPSTAPGYVVRPNRLPHLNEGCPVIV